MKVIVIIPTCSSERLPLLMQTVESIQAGTHKDVHPVIVADGNLSIFNITNKKLHHVSIIYHEKRKDWVYSTNHVFREFSSDYYIYAADDITFPPTCIENAIRTMRERFPDGFGLITIAKRKRAPFGLIGNKLVEHFPERQVFCPDYIHYCSDSEFSGVTKKLGKYFWPPDRKVQVFHHREGGETRFLARQVRERDYAVRDERKRRGYRWGIDFNLVGRG